MTIYPIGTRFVTGSANPKLYGGKPVRECVVTDILRTYNNAGELVRTRYVAQHEFLGQMVTDHDVCAVTIARGLIETSIQGE